MCKCPLSAPRGYTATARQNGMVTSFVRSAPATELLDVETFCEKVLVSLPPDWFSGATPCIVLLPCIQPVPYISPYPKARGAQQPGEHTQIPCNPARFVRTGYEHSMWRLKHAGPVLFPFAVCTALKPWSPRLDPRRSWELFPLYCSSAPLALASN